MKHDARAGSAHRMAERNRSAVHVEFFIVDGTKRAVESELVAAVLLVLPRREAAQDLRCEGFVDFPVIEVIEAEAVTLENRRGGVDWAEAHLRRVEAGPFRVEDAADGLQIEFLQRSLGGEDHPRRAVGDL